MTIFNFIAVLFSQFPKRIPVLLFIMVIAGLLEGIGLGVIVPILEFFFEGKEHSSTSFLSQLFYSFFDFIHLPVSLRSLFGMVLLIFGCRSLFVFLQAFLTQRMIHYFFLKESNTLFQAILTMQWQNYQSRKQGIYLNLLTQEMMQYINGINLSVRLISESILFVFYLLLSCVVSLPLTAIIIGFLSVSYLFLIRYNKALKSYSKHYISTNENYHSETIEQLSAIKWTKSSGNLAYSGSCFSENGTEKANCFYKLNIFKAILPSFFIVYSVFTLSFIAYIALVTFKLSFSYFLLITVIFYRLFPRFQTIQTILSNLMTHLPSVQLIHRQIQSFETAKEIQGTRPFSGLQSCIKLQDISFHFESSKEAFSFSDINITIHKHDFIALVGPSGGGKTTLIDLITGLLTPQSGHVIIDGHPIQEYELSSYRQRIGVVSQDITLFHDTIRSNLCWGLETTIDDDTLIDYTKKAHAYDFISSFPDQFDTIIGERGIRLSGGQRQRLALARALIINPDILILDEATSALDAQSEQFIQDTIESYKGKKTMIIISHRLASVKKADAIVVIDKGRIIEQGTWDALSQNKGTFQLFKDLQILD